MPIVDVQPVLPRGSQVPDGSAARLADALGAALGCGPATLWLRLRPLPADGYAENGPSARPADLPVFVTVLQARPKRGAELQAEALLVAETVAATLAMPRTRVHVEYAPPGAGRIAFGGTLVP